jgi:hypothetical protein
MSPLCCSGVFRIDPLSWSSVEHVGVEAESGSKYHMSAMAALDLLHSRERRNRPRLGRGEARMWIHALRPGIGVVAPFLWSVAAVALATIAGLAMTAVVPLPNVSMVVLLAVLFTAARFGLGPALLASGLSFLAYNFFFIGPLHTFNVTEPHEWLALFVLLAVAVLTSTIAGRARDQARTALERARLAEEVNTVRAAAEAERVRNTLSVHRWLPFWAPHRASSSTGRDCLRRRGATSSLR